MATLLYSVYLLVVIVTTLVTAQDFIRVDSPKINEVVTSKHVVNLMYTVLGFNTGEIHLMSIAIMY